MNETMVDTKYAVLKKLVKAIEPGTRFGLNHATVVECISSGKTDNEIPIKISDMATLMEIDAADKPYNRITLFLFILNHDKKSLAIYRLTAKAEEYAINEAEAAMEGL
jgi:hypothetical protein